jgi:hypothetical protein
MSEDPIMRWFRFNIASLLGFILVCGVAFAALKESSELWENGVFTLTLTVLLVSVLLAIHRSGAQRSFWVGFALFGACYLGLSLVPPIEARLVSSKALAFLHSKLPDEVVQGTFGWRLASTGSGNPNQSTRAVTFTAYGNQIAARGKGFVGLWDVTTGKLIGGWGSSTENFVRIGHSLLALLLAWFGGMLSRRLSRASRPTEGFVPIDAPE